MKVGNYDSKNLLEDRLEILGLRIKEKEEWEVIIAEDEEIDTIRADLKSVLKNI